MAEKELRIHNKSDKPDNIAEKEAKIFQECEELENELPRFLRSFFLYLKGNVLPMSRLAYLHDIRFFCNYLIHETDLTEAEIPRQITLEEFRCIKAADINIYLDYCRKYKVETEKKHLCIRKQQQNSGQKKIFPFR